MTPKQCCQHVDAEVCGDDGVVKAGVGVGVDGVMESLASHGDLSACMRA